jgi:hypothetical protein
MLIKPICLALKFFMTLVVCFAIHNAYSQLPVKKKTKVVILATFHFVSNNDAIKRSRENMLTEAKQKEINELNNTLARFNPNKIFIEWEPQRQKRVDSTYAAFLKGSFPLTGNEVYQIGFKLAKQLNHPTVYCMDAPGDYLFDTVMKTAKKMGQDKAIDSFYNHWASNALKEDSLQRLLTVKERLKIINQESGIMSYHSINAGVPVAPYVGKVGEYAGAEFMGEWYKRNIRMYSNIVRQVYATDNAILVIVGAGHARIIRHFFEDNPAFEVVKAVEILK